MPTDTVHLLAWPDGRVHAVRATTVPAKWAELVKSDGCVTSEVTDVPVPADPTPQRGTVKPAA